MQQFRHLLAHSAAASPAGPGDGGGARVYRSVEELSRAADLPEQSEQLYGRAGPDIVPIRLWRPGAVGAADGCYNPQRAAATGCLLRHAKASGRRDRWHWTEGLAP